jgi:hypothetical protein
MVAPARYQFNWPGYRIPSGPTPVKTMVAAKRVKLLGQGLE